MITLSFDGGFTVNLPNETPDAVVSSIRNNFNARANERVDVETGAPSEVRAVVGAVDGKKDRLATLRKFFPDATVDLVDSDNFLFTSPKTGQVTLYNPKGLDTGDIASVSREALQTVGGAAGAILGAPGGLPGAVAGGALGTTAGEEVAGLAAGALGAEDTRSLGQRALDTATIGASGGIVPGGGAAVGAGAREGVRRTLRGGEAGRREAQSAIDDLSRFGETPSVAQATQSTLLDSFESIIAKIPGGAGRIRTTARKLNENLGEAIERRAQSLSGRGGTDPAMAGAAITKGVEDFGLPRFKDKADVLFRSVNQFAPSKARIDNTKTIVNELGLAVPELPRTSRVVSSPGVANLRESLLADLNLGGANVTEIPFGLLQRLRSTIGRRLANSTLVDDIPRGDLKRIYGALTDDMRTALGNSADPEQALKSFDRANKFYKAGLQRFEDFVEPAIKNARPEKVFDNLVAGGKSGATQIRAVRKSVSPEAWNVLVSAQIRRLGRATPGQAVEEGEFSVNRFLTNWNALDQQAKDALFSGRGLKPFRDDLNALARASGRIRESSQAFANPSGTAGSMVGIAMATGGVGGALGGLATGGTLGSVAAFPLGIGLMALSANQAARLMTSRRFVKWLARSTNIKPNGIGAHMGRLASVAATSDTETRRAIQQFISPFEEVGLQNQPRATSN